MPGKLLCCLRPGDHSSNKEKNNHKHDNRLESGPNRHGVPPNWLWAQTGLWSSNGRVLLESVIVNFNEGQNPTLNQMGMSSQILTGIWGSCPHSAARSEEHTSE